MMYLLLKPVRIKFYDCSHGITLNESFSLNSNIYPCTFIFSEYVNLKFMYKKIKKKKQLNLNLFIFRNSQLFFTIRKQAIPLSIMYLTQLFLTSERIRSRIFFALAIFLLFSSLHYISIKYLNLENFLFPLFYKFICFGYVLMFQTRFYYNCKTSVCRCDCVWHKRFPTWYTI